ncbi:MAG: sensor histidine kinase [Lachnospiraceae bacterium]|nr:sensor histidine kinase [Lachnospiraceae bacterium]
MNFFAYIKDKKYTLLIRGVFYFIVLIFLTALKTPTVSVITVTGVLVPACLLADMVEFNRRRAFYNAVFSNLENLDRKYLISEMLPDADFLEGRLLSEILMDSSKSMAENVAVYRLQTKEFREYIEMWVHEAKLPVAALELICKNNPDVRAKMTGQLKKIDDYIENVLYYARSENAEKDYVIKEYSLQKAFGNAAVKSRELLQLANAEIDASDLDHTVLTDGKWLEFIIGQFIANSLKYAHPSRPLIIKVRAEETEDRVTFYFRDNGIGIPETDLPRIFEKSFTGLNGRKNPGSTGMGLYIVKSLCTRLGHSVTVSSQEDVCTEFALSFAKSTLLKISR